MTVQDEVRALIQLINARLNRATASGDLRAVLTSGDLEEARQLASILDQACTDDIDISMVAVAQHLLGTLRWNRCQLVPEDEGDDDYAAAVSYFELPFRLGLDDIPEPLLPVLANRAIPAAMSHQQSAAETQARHQIDNAIWLWQRIAEQLAPDHPGRAGIVANLGSMLMLKFEKDGSMHDLDLSIEVLQTALAAAADLAQREGILSTLVKALNSRLTITADPADLDRVIDYCAAGFAAAAAADETRVRWVSGWGESLLRRFERDGAATDLDQAIEAMRTALAIDYAHLLPRTAMLYDLASALSFRADRTGSTADLAEAIDIAGIAVRTATPDDVFREPAQSLLDAMRAAVKARRPGIP